MKRLIKYATLLACDRAKEEGLENGRERERERGGRRERETNRERERWKKGEETPPLLMESVGPEA